MATNLAIRSESIRRSSDRVAARVLAANFHKLAEQRRFELAVNAEVQATIAAIFEKRCAEAIEEAVAANQRSVIIDIPTSYGIEEEPIRRQFWWKAGVRCKAIVKHLSEYLRREGFEVAEGEQYYTRTFRGAKKGHIGLHAVPLTIFW